MHAPLVCVFAALAVLALHQGAHGDEKMKMDFEAILKNDELFNNISKCIMDEGPCSEFGAFLKERLPMRLNTKCEGCTDEQKELAKKMVKYFKTNRTAVWDGFKKKYDPESKWNEDEWVNQ